MMPWSGPPQDSPVAVMQQGGRHDATHARKMTLVPEKHKENKQCTDSNHN